MNEYGVKLELLCPGPLIPSLFPSPEINSFNTLICPSRSFLKCFHLFPTHFPWFSFNFFFFIHETVLYMWSLYLTEPFVIHVISTQSPQFPCILVEQLIFSQRTVHARMVLYAHSSHAQVIVCVCMCVSLRVLSCVQLSVTPRAAAHQNSLSKEFPRQEYWSGFPFPSPSNDGASIRECTYTGGLNLDPWITVLRELFWRDWTYIRLCVNKKWTFFCIKPLKFWGIFVIIA